MARVVIGFLIALVFCVAYTLQDDDDSEENAEPSVPARGELQCSSRGGESQSPISIGRSRRVHGSHELHSSHEPKDSTVTQFYGNKYYGKTRDRFYARNDGETYYFQFHPFEQTSEMTVLAEGWDDEYVLAKGRMHWGQNSSHGSEHWIHGENYPLELQLIHYRKKDKSLKQAIGKKDGVLILSILYEIDEERPNPALNALIQGASSVYFPGPLKQIHGPVRLKTLFPLQMAYYEYSGSFTSPPCNEGVKWVVFEERQILTTTQLETLRKLVLENGAPMVDNYRPIQPTNDRSVKYSGRAALNIQLKTVLNAGIILSGKIFMNVLVVGICGFCNLSFWQI